MNTRNLSMQRSGVTGRVASTTRPLGSIYNRYASLTGNTSALAEVSLPSAMNQEGYSAMGGLTSLDMGKFDSNAGTSKGGTGSLGNGAGSLGNGAGSSGDGAGEGTRPGPGETGTKTGFSEGPMKAVARQTPGLRSVQALGDVKESLKTGENLGRNVAKTAMAALRDIALGPFGVIRGAALSAPMKAMAIDREVERLTGKTREEAAWSEYNDAVNSLEEKRGEDPRADYPDHPDITNRNFAKMAYAETKGAQFSLRNYALGKLARMFGFEGPIDGPNRRGFNQSSFDNVPNRDGTDPNDPGNANPANAAPSSGQISPNTPGFTGPNSLSLGGLGGNAGSNGSGGNSSGTGGNSGGSGLNSGQTGANAGAAGNNSPGFAGGNASSTGANSSRSSHDPGDTSGIG
ncbi:MAG: hypothetical protein JEZ11_27920 [Desulfobacterales bacterium]|nr:hypothetical protein [Desulfobacterales bacterium]